MNEKWCDHWLKHSHLLSGMSPCPRGKVGAMIIDERNNPISAGFNGPPRGADGDLCGGQSCDRDCQNIKSGTQIEVGCHHAEQNALMNALHKGVSVAGCTLIVTTPPCLGCARLIHHSGITEVVYDSTTQYDLRGLGYLVENGLHVFRIIDNKGSKSLYWGGNVLID